MKYELDRSEFTNLFAQYNRADNFSFTALDALYDHYEEMDENMVVDIIAICCEWSEYTAEEAIGQYSHILDEDDIKEAREADNLDEYVQEELSEHTTVLPASNGNIVVQEF